MGSRKRRDVRMSEYFDFDSQSGHDNEEEMEEEDQPSATDTVDKQTNDNGDYNKDYFSSETQNDYDGDDEATMEGEQPSYDSKTKLPDFDAVGTYSLDLVGRKRVLLRERRGAVNHLELPEATESSLMAHIDHSQ